MKTAKQIIKAIDELFGNTNVSQQETLDALKDIQIELEIKISAIESDLKRND